MGPRSSRASTGSDQVLKVAPPVYCEGRGTLANRRRARALLLAATVILTKDGCDHTVGARSRVGNRHLPDQGGRGRSDLRFRLRKGRGIGNRPENLLFGPAPGPRAPASSNEDVISGPKGAGRERSLAGLLPGATLLPVAAF